MPIMIITGSSSGIGLKLTRHYLKEGFQVIGCSRKNNTIKSNNYHHFNLDISNEDSVKMMFRSIRKDFGHIDYLINNAGVSSMNYTVLTPLSNVNEVFNTNFNGTFLCCREAIKLMKKNNFGRIVNLSSVHTKLDMPGTSIYGASKAAIEKFTYILANEIFQFGITANTLSLSVVSGTGMAKNLSKKATKTILEKTVSKKVLRIEDVINAINFIIDIDSRMITGQNIFLG